jgi:(p)ppGpp synthase/HD superfamily hydrolase
MIFEAIEMASKVHRGQFRKGTKIPYIIHPLQVAKLLINLECNDEIVTAAILHDTVEDTDLTLHDIEKAFGRRIADLVDGTSEPEKHIPWKDRKEHTIAHLEEAPMEVLYIVCADKYNNIQSIKEGYEKEGERVWNRFSRHKEDQRWYYEAIINVLQRRITEGAILPLFNLLKTEVRNIF